MEQGYFFSDRSWGIFLAFSVHALLFVGGNLGFSHHAEYGMDASTGTSEVDLVAAPAPALSATSETADTQAPREVPPAADPDDIAEPAPTPLAPAPPSAAPVPQAILRTNDLSAPLGDGSSPLAGKDATTVHHAGTSGSYYKPGYFRNPPPPYPEEARRLKQQGRVLLEVAVTADGRTGDSRIKEGSGFPLLDQAALAGVQRWRFRPATVGGLRTESLVWIPIRFQLEH